ncbi:MAG: YdeI/OmpD-associated family protein [Lentisphaeria bacterium]|nr:YdeI/OmpD-associated family protein [Candidatus Neomarinimicrobiota bacterium]MCF7842082.1 YdeI/OmpD-associated family protein [Lentisphaeria bacterium]
MAAEESNLRRPRYSMPGFVKQALEEHRLMAEYQKRPAYQQNDYIGWINRAERQETKEKRLHQMLEELEKGGVYMNMAHPPSRKNKKGE